MSRYLLLLSIFFLGSNYVIGQEKIVVDSIVYIGNKRTKEKTLIRESRIHKGDSILVSELENALQENRNQLLSTGLFNDIDWRLDSTSIDKRMLILEITENWYLYPAIVFELADRNFNVWWQEQNRDLSRTIYGVDISHFNLTGRRDPIGLRLQAGYTRKLGLKYTLPFILGNWGLSANIFYADNKELGYKTENNKPLFGTHPEEEVMLIRQRVGLSLINRSNVFTHHSFRLEIHKNAVNPYVVESLNSVYFLNGRTSIRFFFFEYDFQYDRRDYTLYPRNGYLLGANFKKEGLGIFKEFNNTSLSVWGEYFLPIYKGLVYGIKSKAKVNIDRSLVSYANNTGLGWGGYRVTGFDLYVMDGTDYVIVKNHVNKKLFYKRIKLFNFLPPQFKTLPIELNVRFNFDAAYVNERFYLETNELNNRWIVGFGPALDLIILNNFLFSFEYGFNDIGERGLFIQNSISF